MRVHAQITRPGGKIKDLADSEYVKLIALHLALGLLIYSMRSAAALILPLIICYWLFIIVNRDNKNNEALMAAAYMAGGEVFFRMTGGMIFYETGKYSVILFLLIGMLYKGSSSRTVPFWIYLLILAPGILVASIGLDYDAEFRKVVAFNLSGPVCLGVSALYCYYKKITKLQFEKMLSMFLMPLVANMVYLFLFRQNLDDVTISLSGNFAATGGYGPNQVSTVMGFGAFILTTRLFVLRNKIVNLIDLVLLLLMSYRAIVSFSRGGVITALICAAAFIVIYYYKENKRAKLRIRFKLVVLSAALFLTWLYSTLQTNGLIINRYTNRDASGKFKGDITTGRTELVETELEGFYHNPVVGVGVGQAKELRVEEVGYEIATHSEISRLLSEHGMLGVTAVLILIFVPLVFWLKFKNNYYFLGFMAFWFLTVNHSAMRIALPALVYGLALLYIVDEKKNSVHR